MGHERAANEGQVERFGLLADGVDLHLLVCHLATAGVKGRQEHEPSLVAVLAAEVRKELDKDAIKAADVAKAAPERAGVFYGSDCAPRTSVRALEFARRCVRA